MDGDLVAYSSNRPIAFQLCGAEPSSCRYADARLEGRAVRLAGGRRVRSDPHPLLLGRRPDLQSLRQHGPARRSVRTERAMIGRGIALLALILACWAAPSIAGEPVAIAPSYSEGAVPLITAGGVTAVLTDDGDDAAVLRAAGNLQTDLAKVAGQGGARERTRVRHHRRNDRAQPADRCDDRVGKAGRGGRRGKLGGFRPAGRRRSRTRALSARW